MFIKNALFDKKTYNWKTKAVIFKSLCNFLNIIILIMLFAKFEFDRWIHFFQKQGIIKKIGFPLKPDDVIMKSSNEHEWKGKPRSSRPI